MIEFNLQQFYGTFVNIEIMPLYLALEVNSQCNGLELFIETFYKKSSTSNFCNKFNLCFLI